MLFILFTLMSFNDLPGEFKDLLWPLSSIDSLFISPVLSQLCSIIPPTPTSTFCLPSD